MFGKHFSNSAARGPAQGGYYLYNGQRGARQGEKIELPTSCSLVALFTSFEISRAGEERGRRQSTKVMPDCKHRHCAAVDGCSDVSRSVLLLLLCCCWQGWYIANRRRGTGERRSDFCETSVTCAAKERSAAVRAFSETRRPAALSSAPHTSDATRSRMHNKSKQPKRKQTTRNSN